MANVLIISAIEAIGYRVSPSVIFQAAENNDHTCFLGIVYLDNQCTGSNQKALFTGTLFFLTKDTIGNCHIKHYWIF